MIPMPGDIVLYHFLQQGALTRDGVRSRPALVVETCDDHSVEISVFVRAFDRIPSTQFVTFSAALGIARVVAVPPAGPTPANHTWSPLPRRAPC